MRKSRKNMCKDCHHCDPSKKNEFGLVRCKMFKAYVPLFDSCIYHYNEEKEKLLNEERSKR